MDSRSRMQVDGVYQEYTLDAGHSSSTVTAEMMKRLCLVGNAWWWKYEVKRRERFKVACVDRVSISTRISRGPRLAVWRCLPGANSM